MFFVAEDFLLHGIGDGSIFVTQMSHIMKNDENTTFNDINETSQKLVYIVALSRVLVTRCMFELESESCWKSCARVLRAGCGVG